MTRSQIGCGLLTTYLAAGVNRNYSVLIYYKLTTDVSAVHGTTYYYTRTSLDYGYKMVA